MSAWPWPFSGGVPCCGPGVPAAASACAQAWVGGVLLGALRRRWWKGRAWPLHCAQVAVDAGALTCAGALLRFVPVYVAARVVLVRRWVFHPLVFDFGVAPCTGLFGSTECVLGNVGVGSGLLLCFGLCAAVALALPFLCCLHARAAGCGMLGSVPAAVPQSISPHLPAAGRAPPAVAMPSSTGGGSTGSSAESAASPLRGGDQANLAAAAELCGVDHDALESLKTKSLADSIMALREEQEKLRADRKRVQKDLKNAQRRKRRLKGKARQLTNTDLLEVLLMRQADKGEPSPQEVEGTGDKEAAEEKEPAEEEAGSEP